MARVDWAGGCWRIFDDDVTDFTAENAYIVHRSDFKIPPGSTLCLEGEKFHGWVHVPCTAEEFMRGAK